MKNAGAEKTILREKVLLIAGFIFFCNPVLGMVDFLPDAIGAALVFFGLTRHSLLNDRFEYARRISVFILAAEAFKLLLTIPVTSSGISSNRLAAVALSVVCEAVFFVLFFRAFYGGTEEFSTIKGLEKTSEYCQPAAFAAYVFIAIRLSANLLPELFAIAEVDINSPELSEGYETLEALISARPVIVFASVSASLAAGIYYAVKQTKLLSAFCDEAGGFASEKYGSDSGARSELNKARALKTALVLFCVAPVFALDAAFDGKRLIPLAGTFAFILAGAAALRRISPAARLVKSSAAAFVLSLGCELYRYFFVTPDPVVVYETTLTEVIVSSLLAVAVSAAGLLCVKHLSASVSHFAESLVLPFPRVTLWASWSLASMLWAFQMILPYFAGYLILPRLVAIGVFALALWKTSGDIIRSAQGRVETGMPFPD